MDSADRDMFRAAIHGDREAFEMIIRTMSRPLFAIAFGILQNREEAEDVVQDAFVKAWKSRWRVREPDKFPGWISTIARHRAYDILRRRRTVPLDEQSREFAAAGNGSESLDDERHQQVRWAKFSPTKILISVSKNECFTHSGTRLRHAPVSADF